MDRRLLALFVKASFRSEEGHCIVVGHVDFVLLSDHCVQVGCEDAAEAGSHHNHVVLFEVVWSGFSLFAEAERVGVPGEELPGCDLTHREHNNQFISAILLRQQQTGHILLESRQPATAKARAGNVRHHEQ